eukprot:NODE_10043_length_1380_cov_11.401437.p1 GENE.NODE_10043_length_1380_cov_11.401437~~NODE_10043_length_1380_cov_11.401437.p1  ORF type:complete len:409 (+),score=72.20 NODE_10043_length_1380_cov_11.401437:70-1227(+)
MASNHEEPYVPTRLLPVPRPFEEAEEVEFTAPDVTGGLPHLLARFLVHSMRTYGHVPWWFVLLRFRPRAAVLLLLLYTTVLRRSRYWQNAVHKFLQYGSSRKPRFIKARRVPYDTSRQYLMSHHPHGLLLCPWFNWLSREEAPSRSDAADQGFSTRFHVMDDLVMTLCFAPAVQYMFLHSEIYRDKVTDATVKSVRGILQRSRNAPVKESVNTCSCNAPVKESVMLCPGGFSEATYLDYSDKLEVAYLLGRKGFLKIAITEGIDVIPTYSFGASSMYRSIGWMRERRSKLAQKSGLPLVFWWGRFGTNLPFHEDTVTVSFDPFPASQYTLTELDAAHADYCAYLKICFDAYKGCCAASKNQELVFRGKGHPPPPPSIAIAARAKM